MTQLDNADLHDFKALILHKSDRYREALREEDLAVRLAPDNAQYHYTRGSTLLWLGRTEEAREEFDMVKRLDPDNKQYERGIMESE